MGRLLESRLDKENKNLRKKIKHCNYTLDSEEYFIFSRFKAYLKKKYYIYKIRRNLRRIAKFNLEEARLYSIDKNRFDDINHIPEELEGSYDDE